MSTALSMFPAPMRAEVEGGHRLALGVFVDIGNGFSTQSVLTVDEMGNLGFTKMDQINLECGYLAEEDRWFWVDDSLGEGGASADGDVT